MDFPEIAVGIFDEGQSVDDFQDSFYRGVFDTRKDDWRGGEPCRRVDSGVADVGIGVLKDSNVFV